MDKLDLEKKLRALEIPPIDKAKKELTIQAAMKEFEVSREESPDKSKGNDTERRQRGKKGRFFPQKGGPLMTRPMFATISLMFVALLLAYGFGLYPGFSRHKDVHYYGGSEQSAQSTTAKPVERQFAFQDRITNGERDQKTSSPMTMDELELSKEVKRQW